MFLADDYYHVLSDMGLLGLVDDDNPVVGLRSDGSIGFLNAGWFRHGFATGGLPPTPDLYLERVPSWLLDAYRDVFRHGHAAAEVPARRVAVQGHALGVLVIHERVREAADLGTVFAQAMEDSEAA